MVALLGLPRVPAPRVAVLRVLALLLLLVLLRSQHPRLRSGFTLEVRLALPRVVALGPRLPLAVSVSHVDHGLRVLRVLLTEPPYLILQLSGPLLHVRDCLLRLPDRVLGQSQGIQLVVVLLVFLHHAKADMRHRLLVLLDPVHVLAQVDVLFVQLLLLLFAHEQQLSLHLERIGEIRLGLLIALHCFILI